MDRARDRILQDFPYPIAYPYSLIFQEPDNPSLGRWALCFTEYQLLRLVCLPLVGQYLHEDIDTTALDRIRALNTGIAAIRAPFFSDWIALVHGLRKHLLGLGITPLFPQLDMAFAALKKHRAERLFGLCKDRQLAPLEAIQALRNATAHGGIPDQKEAAQHLDAYLPVLHQVLEAFDFLGDATLRVCAAAPRPGAGCARVRTLRGVQPGPFVEEEIDDALEDAFRESLALLFVPQRRPAPLYPLFNPVAEQEPLFLYDGHYGIQVETKQGFEERSYIYYLGTHHRYEDTASCTRLKELLAQRQISFFLEKKDTAPWTIADSGLDYSRRTLAELTGTKYFPPTYVPFIDLEKHLERFLRVPEPATWQAGVEHKRYVNGFLLIGLAGAGKTAVFARLVAQLLQTGGDETRRDNRNLVLFLRGNGIALRPEGMSLFRDVAEKLGVAVEAATTARRKGGGFSGFRELLTQLHGC